MSKESPLSQSSTPTSARRSVTMHISITRNETVQILLAMSILTFGQVEKETAPDNAKTNQIVIKDFHFDPQVLTVRSGEKITWINRDEEPHVVVSVEKQFKKSGP